MGREIDVVQGYLDKKEHFADLFNGCYFDGRKVVQPDELEEGSEVYNQEYQKKAYQPFVEEEQGKVKKKNAAPRTRDLKKRLKSGGILRVLAIEHQSRVNYVMPWRHMYYDALEYLKQINELSSENKSQHRLKTDEEFLSGLTESDRLAPAFTACLYLGTEPWTGPKNLKEMMNFGEDEEEEGDTVDMCGALKTWGEKKTAEGRAEGRAETVASLVKSGLLKLEEAAAFLNLSIEDMQRNVFQEQN